MLKWAMEKKVKFISDIRGFAQEILTMVRSPEFFTLTIIGNLLIAMSSGLFYLLEKDINKNLHSFMDAIWWSYATVTTTGYGDITAVTFAGKILGILLMLLGTAIFAMYTGLFAEIILSRAKKRR